VNGNAASSVKMKALCISYHDTKMKLKLTDFALFREKAFQLFNTHSPKSSRCSQGKLVEMHE